MEQIKLWNVNLLFWKVNSIFCTKNLLQKFCLWPANSFENVRCNRLVRHFGNVTFEAMISRNQYAITDWRLFYQFEINSDCCPPHLCLLVRHLFISITVDSLHEVWSVRGDFLFVSSFSGAEFSVIRLRIVRNLQIWMKTIYKRWTTTHRRTLLTPSSRV